MRTLCILLLTISFNLNAQNLNQFNEKRLNIDKKLMLTLGGWSLTNAVVSSIGWGTTTGEAQQFHQMNTIWSGFNLALAIPGYIKACKTVTEGIPLGKTNHEQNRTEKIFLFNAGLDLAYVTGGFYLKSLAKNNVVQEQRLNGYGNSVILQGGFLFLFDLTAYLIHAAHRKNQLHPILDKIELSSTGLGIKYQLGQSPNNQLNNKAF